MLSACPWPCAEVLKCCTTAEHGNLFTARLRQSCSTAEQACSDITDAESLALDVQLEISQPRQLARTNYCVVSTCVVHRSSPCWPTPQAHDPTQNATSFVKRHQAMVMEHKSTAGLRHMRISRKNRSLGCGLRVHFEKGPA